MCNFEPNVQLSTAIVFGRFNAWPGIRQNHKRIHTMATTFYDNSDKHLKVGFDIIIPFEVNAFLQAQNII